MPRQKAHQLLLLFFISCVVVALALLLLAPMLGVLWILLVALFCIVLAVCKPALLRDEKERWQRVCRKVKESLFSEQTEAEVDTPAQYELVVIKPNTGQRYSIDKKVYLIGRGSKCDCKLSNVGTIGREHCRIVYREHSCEYYIEDLRSKNGTYLGTRRLEPNTQVKLLENSELYIGDYGLRFEKKLRG